MPDDSCVKIRAKFLIHISRSRLHLCLVIESFTRKVFCWNVIAIGSVRLPVEHISSLKIDLKNEEMYIILQKL